MTKVQLCDTCAQAVTDIVSGELNPSRWTVSKSNPVTFVLSLGDNLKLARNHLSESCALCSEAYRSMSEFYQPDFGTIDSTRSMPYMYKYSTEAPHAVLEICEAPAKNSASSEKQVRRTVIFELYRCGLQCDNAEAQEDTTQLDVKLCSELLGRLGTPKINYSGSIEAMDLMATWSSQCLQGHPRCAHRNSAQRLPTRVLDLGPASPAEENGSYLRLMSSNGRRARYACLSYRWSSLAQQYRTTRQNYHEHLCNIAIQRLPQTFRDAIKLVRHLGLRYLWIDCLCIIQDDDDDWERECGRMASIFEHSFITISALSAKDSTYGLFHRWNTFDAWKLHIQTRDGTQIGLRGEQSTLKGDLENSSMSLRGWILQEKILSPALAHFGHTQIHWECLTGTTSELRATYLLPTNSPLKYFLHEVRRSGLEKSPQGPFISWYILMQRYSRMALTVETDRLPAIMGLAQRFQECFGATFVAGLWVENLHGGLLWHSSRQRKPSDLPKSRASSAISPSWSWIHLAGVSTQISFEWFNNKTAGVRRRMIPVKRVISDTDLRLVDVWTSHNTALRKGAIKGYIQLWGVVHKVQVCGKGTVVRQSTARKEKIKARLATQSVQNAYSSSSDPEVLCRIDIECSELLECYLLVVSDWSFEDTSNGSVIEKECSSVDRRCFLLLKRLRRPRRNANLQDLGRFERIGLGAGIPLLVERLCGNLHEKKFLTIT